MFIHGEEIYWLSAPGKVTWEGLNVAFNTLR